MKKEQEDNAINRFIRQRIIEARKEKKETQSELAKKLKTSQVTVSDMERGRTAINASILVQIAHHYKKSIGFFYPPEETIKLSAIEEELLELFKELSVIEQYAHIDYIKKQVKISKKGT